MHRLIESYVHNGRIGVLVELTVTDLIATKSEAFLAFARDLAMHIAASAPSSVEALLQQPFVKNPDKTVERLMREVAGTLREKIAV